MAQTANTHPSRLTPSPQGAAKLINNKKIVLSSIYNVLKKLLF